VELNHVRVLRSQWKPRRNFDSLKTFCPLRFSLENKQGNTQNTRHAQEKGREREGGRQDTHSAKIDQAHVIYKTGERRKVEDGEDENRGGKIEAHPEASREERSCSGAGEVIRTG